MNILEKFIEYCRNSESCVLCTVVEESGSTPRSTGAAMLVLPGGKIEGTIGGGITEHNVIQRALQMMSGGEEFFLFRERLSANSETPDLHAACGGELSVFMQGGVKKNQLVIFGAGHVGCAVAECATFAGFDVVLWDERSEFAAQEKFPFAKVVCCPLDETPQKIKLSDGCYVVVVTRGHALDAEVIKILENTPAKYIGVIGSKTKIAHVREKLLKENISPAHLDRLSQPVGLPIRAETPNEIAVSIIAEIIAVRRDAKISELRKLW